MENLNTNKTGVCGSSPQWPTINNQLYLAILEF